MVSNDGSEELRASVLEAALDIGVQSPTFTEWMGGSSLSSQSGNNLAGLHAPLATHPSPFTPSPGDLYRPNNNTTPTQINYQAHLRSRSHSRTPPQRQGSSSDHSHSSYTDYSFSRNPSTSSSYSYDGSASDQDSFRSYSKPTMPENSAPTSRAHGIPNRPRAESEAPQFATYQSTAFDDPSFSSSRSTYSPSLYKKEKNRLRKRRPATRDGYETDASVRNDSLGKYAFSRPSSPGRTRVSNESRHTTYIPSSSPPVKGNWQPISEDPQSRIPAPPLTKKKSFLWGFKKSKSSPDFPKEPSDNGSSTSFSTITPPVLIDMPPLPAVRVSEPTNVNMNDRRSNRSTIAINAGYSAPFGTPGLGSIRKFTRNRTESDSKKDAVGREQIAKSWAPSRINRPSTSPAIREPDSYNSTPKPSRPTVQTEGIKIPQLPNHVRQRHETAWRPQTFAASGEKEGSIRSEKTIKPEDFVHLRVPETRVETVGEPRRSNESHRRSVSLDSRPPAPTILGLSNPMRSNTLPEDTLQPPQMSFFIEEGFVVNGGSAFNSPITMRDPFRRLTPVMHPRPETIVNSAPRASQAETVSFSDSRNTVSDRGSEYLTAKREQADVPRSPGQSMYLTPPRSPISTYSPGGASTSSGSTSSSQSRSTASSGSPLLTPNTPRFHGSSPLSYGMKGIVDRGTMKNIPLHVPLSPELSSDSRQGSSVLKGSKLRDLARALDLDFPSPIEPSLVAPSIVDSIPSPIAPSIVDSIASPIAPSIAESFAVTITPSSADMFVSPKVLSPVDLMDSPIVTSPVDTAPSPVDSVVTPVDNMMNGNKLLSPAMTPTVEPSPIDSFRTISMYSAYTTFNTIEIPDYLCPDDDYEEMPALEDSDSVKSVNAKRFSTDSSLDDFSLDDLTSGPMHAPIFRSPVELERSRIAEKTVSPLSARKGKTRPPDIQTKTSPVTDMDSEVEELSKTRKTSNRNTIVNFRPSGHQRNPTDTSPSFLNFDDSQPSPPSTASSSSSRQSTPTNFTQRTRLAPRSPSRFITNSPKSTPSTPDSKRATHSCNRWL